MEYKNMVLKYIENVKLCEKYRFNIDDNQTKENLINQLIDNNIKINEIFSENNKLLNELFYNYKNLELMGDEEYNNLKYFSQELFDKLYDEDFGLIFEICCLLTKYSHLYLDIEEQLENENNLSRLNFYLKINLYPYIKDAFKAYFSINDDKYFKLSKNSRNYYIRLKSNIYCGSKPKNNEELSIKIESIKDFVKFIHCDNVTQFDDFPFDTWNRLALINVNVPITAIRDGRIIPTNKDLLNLESLLKYYDLNLQFNNHYSRINYLLSYVTLMFHLNKIDLNTLIYSFNKMLEFKADGNEEELLATKLRIKSNIIMYLYNYGDDIEKCKHILNECMEKLDSCRELTKGIIFDRLYHAFAIEGIKLYGFDEYKEQLYKLMIHRHSATFIHSSMVKEISSILLEEYLNKYPKLKNKGFENIIIDCATFHDLGKYHIMPIIRINHRFLTTCELEQIFLHPEYGLEFFKDIEVNKYIEEVVQFHHQSYDGTLGYPNKYNKEHSFILDIIKVADCLDAASDHIGRPFNSRKKFDEIYYELKTFSGKQYAPNIVCLLEDDVFRNKLENKIRIYREELYYQKYIK